MIWNLEDLRAWMLHPGNVRRWRWAMASGLHWKQARDLTKFGDVR